MTDTKPKIRKSIISGRELFLCDDLVEPIVQQQIAALVKTMHYVRAEKSRQDVPGLVSIVGKIQINIGRVKDPAYRTMYFRVPAEEERL